MDASLLLNLEIANKHYQVNTIFIEINNIISISTKNPKNSRHMKYRKW